MLFENPLDIHPVTVLSLASAVKHPYNDWNTKFCDPTSIKYFAPLKTLSPFIKSFLNPFVDISLTSVITYISFV